MRKGKSAVLVCLIGSAFSQVLAPPEILDSGMRALQQKHLPELKAAALDITAHEYPYRFYLSRTLDVTERQEQVTDQRSIRFADFHGRTVLQVTGNYFAAYSDKYMDRNERVRRTWLDVMLPILRATAPRLQSEPQLTAFAIEISHHVRKQVMGVTMEKPENLALVVPRAVAAKVVMSSDINDQIAALRESSVFVDGSPVELWPEQEIAGTPEEPKPGVNQPAKLVSSIVPGKPAAPEPLPVAAPAIPRDLSPEALQRQQVPYQGLLDRIAKDLDPQAHFISYAPPALVAFHNASYLQLSVATTLAPSDSGSQYRIAALAFDRHVSHLIRPLLAFFKQDPEFDGVVFSTTVRIAGGTADSPQSVEFFLPLRELRRYEQYDITGQQLIDSGLVLINGERVGLELQSAESDRR
jgi:hypothetical protein